MHKKIIRDERGDLSFFTVFVILAINMLLAFVLLFASIKINCINIRNAAKMELNNVSARIYADIFHSQREANLDSYMADLHLSSAYQEALRAGFILGMEERIQLTSDDYTVDPARRSPSLPKCAGALLPSPPSGSRSGYAHRRFFPP